LHLAKFGTTQGGITADGELEAHGQPLISRRRMIDLMTAPHVMFLIILQLPLPMGLLRGAIREWLRSIWTVTAMIQQAGYCFIFTLMHRIALS